MLCSVTFLVTSQSHNKNIFKNKITLVSQSLRAARPESTIRATARDDGERGAFIITNVPPRVLPALVVDAGRQTGPMASSEPPARGRITAKKEATQLNAETQIARRVLTLCGPTAGPTSVTRTRPNPLRSACVFQALRLSFRDQFWSRIPRLKMVLHLPNPGGLKMQCCVEAVVKVMS